MNCRSHQREFHSVHSTDYVGKASLPEWNDEFKLNYVYSISIDYVHHK